MVTGISARSTQTEFDALVTRMDSNDTLGKV